MSRDRLPNRHLNPLLHSLPDWVQSYRPHQSRAIADIMAAFEDVDVVVLDAPTGAGKTLIAETVRRMLQRPTVYMCSSKSLQHQFISDFPYAKVVMGRANYPTELYPDRWSDDAWESLSCADCTMAGKKTCEWCTSALNCPYQVAKTEAAGSELAVVNTAYFLNETRGFKSAFSRKDDGFVVVDEADTLEKALMSHVSVEVGRRRAERMGWDHPEKVTVPSAWPEWLEGRIEDLAKEEKRVRRKNPVHEWREKQALKELRDKFKRIRDDLAEDLDGTPWVYTGKDEISFKPSRVDSIGAQTLWRHGKKWLLMSATIISAQEIIDSTGCDRTWASVRVPSTFPKENRKVYVRGVAENSRRNQEDAWPKIAGEVKEIVGREREKGHNILVHSVSYALTKTIVDSLGGNGDGEVHSYMSAGGRAGALEGFVKEGGVLVAPSLDRGIDLPDDCCRVQILVKVPYPYLGDRQISARLRSKGGQTWYNVQTVRSIVQMCGRAVRHEEDWAVTYILDNGFKTNLWNKSRGLFPEWFKESLVW